MRVSSILAAVLGTTLATSVFAAPTLPGINIRWDNCYADGGVMNKSFACDTNTGADLAVLSLQLDTGMSPVSGVEIRVSIKPAASALPAWWEFQNVGSCRQTSLNYLLSPVLPAGNCVDWGDGFQSGGFPSTGYHLDEIGPGSAVAFMVAAVPPSNLQTLDAGTEYVVGALRLNHAKTVGAGSCSGCNTPVCILFTSLDVTTPVRANDRLFTQGANGPASQIIHWQNGQLTNLVNHCTGTFACTTQYDCLAATPTEARRSTWGAVKSLYR
jgi:hypothetical protein